MAEAASDGRNGERNQLMILLLFETGLRVSEALSLTLRLIGQYERKLAHGATLVYVDRLKVNLAAR